MSIGRNRESDLNRELEHHLHHLTANYKSQGYTPEEARRMAAREFGGAEQVNERCRDENRWAWSTGLRQDVTFGLRMMRRTPMITAAAILTLALGIGANTAIVSLMDQVLWRRLPLPNPGQLSLVHWLSQRGFMDRELFDSASGSMDDEGGVGVADFFSYATYLQMESVVAKEGKVAAFVFPDSASVSYNGRATIARERPVSGNFFSALGVAPELGRLFGDADDSDAASPAVVVSSRFWREVLGSDTGAIGRAITIDNTPFTVVGVLDRSFYGLFPGDPTEIYAPLHHATTIQRRPKEMGLENDRYWGLSILTRQLVSDSSFGKKLDRAFHQTWSRTPKDVAKGPRLRLDPGERGLGFLRDQFRSSLFILGGLVTLLFLIACTNIANLLLARSVARRRELAMRVSLGCSRGRLIRQFLTESVLLAAFGSAASVAIAYGTAKLLSQFLSGRDSGPVDVVLDARMLLTLLGVTVIALVAFGLFPAWQGSRRLHFTWLKQGTGSLGDATRRGWSAARTFVVLQVALSLVLVVSALGFTRNLIAIRSADPGFDRRNMVLFGTRPGSSGYTKDRLPLFYARLRRELESVPGVTGVGLASMRPMDIGGWWESVELTGHAERYDVNVNGVTPTYLPLYKLRLVAGRMFTEAEVETEAKVAILSEDLARKLGGAGVLGHTITIPDGPPGQVFPVYEVVGIAPNMAATDMKRRPSVLWLPFGTASPDATVVIRTAIAPQAALPAIRRTMESINRNLPMVDTMTMEEQISRGLQRERMFATLCNCFGILALVLSIVGIYCAIAYNVSRRRGEIGLRLALGANPKDIVAIVLWEGMTTVVAGMALGGPLLWWGTVYAKKALPEDKGLDPSSIAFALAIVMIGALLGTGIPAIRASSVDPAETLRAD